MIPVVELERRYQECRSTDLFQAAKIAFALAVRLRGSVQATAWAVSCVCILLDLQGESPSIDKCAAGDIVGGVCIPDYFHASLVRERFGLAV